MPEKIILLTLRTFSSTGGIQKMTRTLAHALCYIAKQKEWDFNLWSVYDSRFDLMEKYLSEKYFTGFGRNKLKIGLKTLKSSFSSDIIILSHVNLALFGLVIKILNPRSKVWLIAHGVEVWRPLTLIKKIFVRRYCDKILCVSNFTKIQMMGWHKSDPEKCVVLNNALDPYGKLPLDFSKPEYLMNRYSLTPSNKVIFTLTRLASSEQYKGYEQVIIAISHLKYKFPEIKYILSGQSDISEETRIRELISLYRVDEQVILTGFVTEKELADYFLLADLFVLPSKKEGFGIVFIEALACGLPVICGNADGSIDAIRGGELGTAINVSDQGELEEAIIKYLERPLTVLTRKELQDQCVLHFDESHYINSLMDQINNG